MSITTRLQQLKADGYKWLYYEELRDYEGRKAMLATVGIMTVKPLVTAVDMIFPGDTKSIRIDEALANPSLIAGRRLNQA
jgi:hypothetical protein